MTWAQGERKTEDQGGGKINGVTSVGQNHPHTVYHLVSLSKEQKKTAILIQCQALKDPGAAIRVTQKSHLCCGAPVVYEKQ